MRLPNGYGSIFKLKGNRRNPWCARKTTGWKDNGQPIYTYIGYYPTRQEALTALADFNKDPYDLQICNVTFSELYDRWSEEHFKKISGSGITAYSGAYRSCERLYKMRVTDTLRPFTTLYGRFWTQFTHSENNEESLWSDV